MLGRSCQRETEERQKERVGQMVGLVGQTARCQRCFQRGDASLSLTSIEDISPGLGSQFPNRGNPVPFPREGMSIPGRSSLHLLNNGRPNDRD